MIALIAGLLFCASLGFLAAVAWDPRTGETEGGVLRVRQGVTEVGRVEAVTTEGQVARVVRWSTRHGIETQTIEGPLQIRTADAGTTLVVNARPQSLRIETIASSGDMLTATIVETVTLPPETVTETATETVVDTSTATVTLSDEGTQTAPAP